MQELRITQEMDGYDNILTLLEEDWPNDNLLLKIEGEKTKNNIVIKKFHAKKIISFLQNYFNL